jgi:hypothetical protein
VLLSCSRFIIVRCVRASRQATVAKPQLVPVVIDFGCAKELSLGLHWHASISVAGHQRHRDRAPELLIQEGASQREVAFRRPHAEHPCPLL